MSLNLWPSRSLYLVPSLASSWCGPCQILRLVWMMTFYSALYGLSAFIWTVSLLCLLFAVDFSCRLVALHVLSRRTPSPSSCVTLFLMLELLGLRWVASGLMTSAVCPPRSPFTVTGRSPQFWSRPLGPPVRCLHPSTYAIFNTSSMASCLWVCLWLRVLGSGNPHLFLTCSGEGGGPTRSWSLLLRGFFMVSGLVVGPAQPVPIQCGRYSLSIFLLLLANDFNCLSAFCLFYL